MFTSCATDWRSRDGRTGMGSAELCGLWTLPSGNSDPPPAIWRPGGECPGRRWPAHGKALGVSGGVLNRVICSKWIIGTSITHDRDCCSRQQCSWLVGVTLQCPAWKIRPYDAAFSQNPLTTYSDLPRFFTELRWTNWQFAHLNMFTTSYSMQVQSLRCEREFSWTSVHTPIWVTYVLLTVFVLCFSLSCV